MIIKKKNKSNNTDNKNITNTQIPETSNTDKAIGKEEEVKLFEPLSDISERQERRRGDRRRGYRRIEDRNLVSRAQEEAKVIKNQATQDGFNEGILKADEEIANLQKAIASLLDVKKEAYEFYQNDIIDIALEVAKKILGKQAELDPNMIIDIVLNVIKEISEEDNKITFIINPQDELVLSENLENNSAFNKKRATMSIQTSDNIERGSCRVLTNSGQIDATFSSQLSIIKKAFKEGI
ncbi:MAG: hypothetical protein MJ180_04275 [Candidatus Gastranaerophilales bacterium]|nr:hypothetical protein [Candidatus Gastranaerophilales bacterium]